MIRIVVSELGAAPTANVLHHEHWSTRAAVTRSWRDAAAVKWRERNLRPVDLPVSLVVWQSTPPQRRLPDCDAMSVVAKAILDGAVDAGVLPEDSPEFVVSVVLGAPERCGVGVLPAVHAAIVSALPVGELVGGE